MTEFAFFAPKKTRFGAGVISEIGEEVALLGGTSVLIVTDPGLRGTGIVDRVVGLIKEHAQRVEVFDSVVANPIDDDCVKGAQLAVEVGADLVVGLGGGSSMDTAKTIAVLMTHGGQPKDYFGADTLSKPIAPLICAATTSGTGSEVTPFAVITDSSSRVKMNILDSRVVPLASFVDPELTSSMPAGLTASTGMDALTHAIEAYTCNLANPLTDALALKAVAIIAASLRAAVADGSDVEARTQMALGSLIAGYAFGNADVGGVHCMAEAIGGFYDTPHGVANSVFLPIVTEFNVPSNIPKHADVAAAMGVDIAGMSQEEAAAAGVGAIRQLAKDLSIPRFSELKGVKESDFDTLSKLAAANVSAESNPRTAGPEEYLGLFRQAWGE
jgi:alcohol dehydrogenase